MARAAGVHLVFGTQMLESEVITPLIKANFEARIAFATADDWRSRIILDDSRAAGLPTGRMIFRRDGQYTEYQSCFISPQQTRLVIRQIAKYGPDGGLGNDEGRRFLADAKLLVVTSCERLQGDFTRTKLLKEPGIKGVITQERFNEIAKRLEADGIIEPGRSRQPRRVARGYMNRVYLLDLVYNQDSGIAVNDEDTAPTENVRGLVPETDGIAQQNAVEATSIETPDVVGGLDISAPMRAYLESLGETNSSASEAENGKTEDE